MLWRLSEKEAQVTPAFQTTGSRRTPGGGPHFEALLIFNIQGN
jgi:hypothetical protein